PSEVGILQWGATSRIRGADRPARTRQVCVDVVELGDVFVSEIERGRIFALFRRDLLDEFGKEVIARWQNSRAHRRIAQMSQLGVNDVSLSAGREVAVRI